MSLFGARRQREELAAGLKRLRSLSGLSGRDLGERMGVDQSTVSRIERAEQRVTLRQVVSWCDATGADEETRERLLALAEALVAGPATWAESSDTGSTDLQRDVQALEAKTGLLSVYQPAGVPGLLQTAAYARRVLSSGPDGVPRDIAQRVMSRMERQRVLYDGAKTFRFVIPEAVLRWPYGPPDDPAVPDEHREQLARIGWAAGRANIQLGILPLAPVAAWRLSGFVIFDDVSGEDPVVHIEGLARAYNEDLPEHVAVFRRAFDRLLAASVTGDEARQLISAAAGGL